MKTLWVNTMIKLPADGQAVWIKRLLHDDYPFQAVWSQVTGLFSFVDASGTPRTISLVQVWSWRPK